MEKLLKSKSGIAAIVVILILVVAVGAGGATVLAVRMVVTGEDYLQPFVDLGLISSEEDDDKEDDEDEEIITANSDIKGVSDVSRLSDETLEGDAVQYYGSIDMATSEGMTSSDEDYKAYKDLVLEVSLFAVDDKVTEIVFRMDIAKFLKSYYELYEEEAIEEGYDTYQEFEDDFLDYFESIFEAALYSADDEMEDYVDIYEDDGVVEIYVTEKGFESLYETYDIEEGSSDVDDFIDALEDSMGVTMKKV